MNALNCISQSTPLSTSLYSKVSTPLYTNPASEDYNLANLVRNALSDPDLSNGASRILVQIILSAGRKGYVHFLISTLCTLGKMGRTRCKECLSELQTKNRIRIVHRPGRSSEYQVIGIFQEKRKVSRSSDLIKKYTLKNKTVSKPGPASPKVFCDSLREEKQPDVILNTQTNREAPDPCFVEVPAPDPDVIASDSSSNTHKISCGRAGSEPLPKPKTTRRRQVIRFDLVREILDITRDHKSLGFWIKLVKHVDPETVCYMISSLRLAISSGQVESPGRYLVGICKRVCPWIFEIPSKKQALRASQPITHGQLCSKPVQEEPVGKPDFETGLEQVRRIRELLGRKVA